MKFLNSVVGNNTSTTQSEHTQDELCWSKDDKDEGVNIRKRIEDIKNN